MHQRAWLQRNHSGVLRSVALAGLCVALVGCDGLAINKEIADAAESNDPGYSVTGAELIETDEQGLPRYRLTADRILQNPASSLIDVENPVLRLHEQGTLAWTVSARHAQLPGTAQIIALDGNVKVAAASNETTPLALSTSSLQYDFLSGVAQTDATVSLLLNGHQLQGTGLEANLRTRRARLNEAVQGRFTP